MTPNAFRKLALAQAGAEEGRHMDHPDFRVGGRIFATLAPDGERGGVKLAPAEQRRALRAHPTWLEAAAGAWGRQGFTLVDLAGADPAAVRGLVESAWRSVSSAAAGRKERPPRRAGD